MNGIEWFLLIGLGITYPLGIWIVMRQNEFSKRIKEIEKKRTKFYQSLTDPKKIEEEMEKGARLREMKDAGRTTLPREDQVGQNAKVYRPRMRSKLPPRWNPPSP